MIPLYDNVPTRRVQAVCIALIVINVLVFLADQATLTTTYFQARNQFGQIVQVPQQVGGLTFRYAMVPAQITGAQPGAPYIQPVWLTIFTSMFLHSGWLHIGGNMLCLWIFGNNIEDVVGRYRFILFYFVCGVAAAGLQVLSDPGSTIPTVGASGAIAGVMGAYIWLYPGARVLTIIPIFIFGMFVNVPAFVVIGFWRFLTQFFDAYLLGGGGMQGGGVAYFAHVGGFVMGLALIVLLGGRSLVTETPQPFDARRAPLDDEPGPYDR